MATFCLLIIAVCIAGIHADCVPQAIKHTEIGDDLYRVLLADLAEAEVKAAQIAKAAQSGSACKKFEDLDFFTQLLVTITADNTWLENLAKGVGSPTGDECIGVNTRVDFDLKNIQAKASVPVPGTDCNALTGAALSQYTLQRFGLTLTALGNAPTGSMGGGSGYAPAPPPGKYQKYVQDLNDGIAAARKIIAAGDAAACLAGTKTLSNGLTGILEAGNITTINIPDPVTTTTTAATTTAKAYY